MTSSGLLALADAPTRSAFLEAQVGASEAAGAFGQLSAGYRPLPRLGLFGWGRLETGAGWSTGAGARWDF